VRASGAVVHLNSGPSWPGHSSIACVEALALRSDHLGVEATQHTGDEIFSAERGLARDWTPAEAQTPV
jgi:hypothetical protein